MYAPLSLAIIHITLLSINIILSSIYVLPIIVNRRFHHPNSLATANLAFAVFCCSTIWLFSYILPVASVDLAKNNVLCILLNYFPTTVTSQVPLAIVQGSFHRLLSIVYRQRNVLNNNSTAIIFIVIQWLIGFIAGLPVISMRNSNCVQAKWLRIYHLLVIVIVPSLICAVNNFLIFNHVRSSSRRVHSSVSVASLSSSLQVNRRDLHLARHMIIMFCVFVGGWSPYLTYNIVYHDTPSQPLIFDLFIHAAELSLTCNLLNLFLYNHELRKYLQNRLIECRS